MGNHREGYGCRKDVEIFEPCAMLIYTKENAELDYGEVEEIHLVGDVMSVLKEGEMVWQQAYSQNS